MNSMLRTFSLTLSCLVFSAGCGGQNDGDSSAVVDPDAAVLRLATTTSVRDSGLLEKLLPAFEQAHRCRVDVIAVGTGAALKLGEGGEADAVIVHARDAENAFMQAGHGTRHEEFMENSFLLLGPSDDPAGIRGKTATEAFRAIAGKRVRFISRGDDSGTHKRELQLWAQSGGRPEWDGYIESGQGMGPSLVMADEMTAYVMSDQGTWLNFRGRSDLEPLVTDSKGFLNPYAIMTVNPALHPQISGELATALVDYLISPETQRKIAAYRIAGEQLFRPTRLEQPETDPSSELPEPAPLSADRPE